MSAVLHFYPGDQAIAGSVLAVLAISIVAATALVAAKLLERRPPLRYSVLAAALLCILATPLIAILLRVSGNSTFAWDLPAARWGQGAPPAGAAVDSAIADWPAHEAEPDPAGARLDWASAGTSHGPARPRPERLAEPIAVAGPAVAAATHGGSQAVRVGLTLATLIWLIGCAVRAVRFARASACAYRIWWSAEPCSASLPQRVGNEVRRCLGKERLPAILASDEIQSPSAVGVLRGAIILPAGMITRLTTAELCDVLVHEGAHVVRRDPLMRNLQVAAGLLFWPIPLVHWLNRQLSCACEEICDNYVLAHRDALQYADTLLRIAMLAGQVRHSLALVGMLSGRGKLESRVARLLDERTSTATRVGRSRAAICLGVFLLASVAVCGAEIRAARPEGPLPTAGPDAGGIDPQAAEPAAPIEIEVWWGVDPPLNQAFEQQVSRFNGLQDEIVVAIRLFAGYGDLHRALNQALEADELPDVAVVEIHQVPILAAAGQIQALDALISQDRGFRPEDFLAGILANLRYRDKLYALPMNRSTPILYYNKDRFAAAGLDPQKPPATWQELREMSRALTSADRRQYGLQVASSPWVFESLVWSNGGELFVDGRPAFAEFGAGPLQLWADMVHRDRTAQFVARGERRTEFASGRAAMAVDSTALLQEYLSGSKFAVGTAPLPRSELGKNAVPTGGGAAVIPAAIPADRKFAAWKFLTWFTATQQAARWSRETGYIPVRQSARSRLRAEGFYGEHPEFDVAIEQMKFAREAPPEWATAWKIIAEKMTSVVCDDAPALPALEGAEREVARLLNQTAASKP